MAKTEFFLPMKPPTVTHQEKDIAVVMSKKKGKHVPVVYDSTELKAARSKLLSNLGMYVPEKKYTGAIRMMTKWCFPITGKHHHGEYKTTKPDTDNLQKMLKDVMTELGFWTDDALVASEITEKFWAETPGIYIKIEELG
jgi:Holliday junction resolvase RusA-like endonuclease